MSNSVLGNLLVAFLLVAASSRIFFLKHERVDAVAVLVPLAFVASVLQIVAWNADAVSMLLFVLSCLAFFVNIRALSRVAAKSYADVYSPVFIVLSMLIAIASLAAAFLAVRYAPVNMMPKTYDVVETKTRLVGNFTDGFKEAGYFALSDATLYLYEPLGEKKSDAVVIVGSDKRGDAASYRPYMMLLAQKGYAVLTCDFYVDAWFSSLFDTRYVRRLAMLVSFFYDAERFSRQKDFYTFNMRREYAAMMALACQRFGDDVRFCIICDGMADNAAVDIVRQDASNVMSALALDSISEYRTPGFGFIEQTDPLLAAYFGHARDKTAFIPRYLVLQTIKRLEQ